MTTEVIHNAPVIDFDVSLLNRVVPIVCSDVDLVDFETPNVYDSEILLDGDHKGFFLFSFISERCDEMVAFVLIFFSFLFLNVDVNVNSERAAIGNENLIPVSTTNDNMFHVNVESERIAIEDENLIFGSTTNDDMFHVNVERKRIAIEGESFCDSEASQASARQTRRRRPRHGLGDLTMVDTNVGRVLRAVDRHPVRC